MTLGHYKNISTDVWPTKDCQILVKKKQIKYKVDIYLFDKSPFSLQNPAMAINNKLINLTQYFKDMGCFEESI